MALHLKFFFLFSRTILCHWDFSYGKFGLLCASHLQQLCYQTYGTCWVFQCFYNLQNSDMDYVIFYIWLDINSCMLLHIGVCRHCKRVRKESWLWEKNPLPPQGIKLPQRCVSPTLYQMNYIPVLIRNFWTFSEEAGHKRSMTHSLVNLHLIVNTHMYVGLKCLPLLV